MGERLSAERILPYIGKYLFCAFSERQLKKINPIMKRRFIFLRLQDHFFKTTRPQDYKTTSFWGKR